MLQLIDYEAPQAGAQSLKQKLVAAVANGNETVASELRLLLKMNRPERLRGTAQKH